MGKGDTTPIAISLEQQLEETLARERRLRLAYAREFMQNQAQTDAQVKEIERLHALLQATSTTLHGRNLALQEKDELYVKVSRDLEWYAHQLTLAESRQYESEQKLARIKRDWTWQIGAPGRAFRRWLKRLRKPSVATDTATEVAVSPGQSLRFVYHFTPPPHCVVRDKTATWRGWILVQEDHDLSELRLCIGDKVYTAAIKQSEPRPDARFGQVGPSGFTVTFSVGSGTHLARLEARVDDKPLWHAVLNVSIRTELL